MSDPLDRRIGDDGGTSSGTTDDSVRPVTAVIDAYHEADSGRHGLGDGEDPDAAFERRLATLVGWAIDNDVAFDRAWTIRTDRLEYDVMAEFVYLAKQRNHSDG